MFTFKKREYFKMRRSCHGKDDWLDIKWKGGEITPTMQQDTFTCGPKTDQVGNFIYHLLTTVTACKTIYDVTQWMANSSSCN
jgi:hypothetical protein